MKSGLIVRALFIRHASSLPASLDEVLISQKFHGRFGRSPISWNAGKRGVGCLGYKKNSFPCGGAWPISDWDYLVSCRTKELSDLNVRWLCTGRYLPNASKDLRWTTIRPTVAQSRGHRTCSLFCDRDASARA